MAEVKTTEEYDGTNWSAAGTATSVGGEFAALAGVQTDAFAVGGYTGSYHGNSEKYDGTSWSSEAAFPSSLDQHAGSPAGSGEADYLVAGSTGGENTDKDGIYSYNGSSWTAENNLPAQRYVACGNGPTGDFLMSQGQDSSRRADSVTFSLGGSPATGPSVSSGRYSPTSSVACSGSANGVVFGGGTGSANSAGTNQIQEFD